MFSVSDYVHYCKQVAKKINKLKLKLQWREKEKGKLK